MLRGRTDYPERQDDIELMKAELAKAEARLETEFNAVAEESCWLDTLTELLVKLFGEPS